MPKTALFVFNGDSMCFIHVLLNALDLKEQGAEVKIIIEGAAVKLLPELDKPANPLHALWQKTLAAGLVDGVCRACAGKLGTLEAAKEQNLPLLGAMSGHPAISAYMKSGYKIITF